jgi:hypothetical protein
MIVAYNNTVTLARGDTCKIPLTEMLSREHKNYILMPGDIVYFGLMLPGQLFEQAFLKKKFSVEADTPLDSLVITLTSNETVDLLDRKYFYSIKLLKNHTEIDKETNESIKIDEVVTLVNKTKFIICD